MPRLAPGAGARKSGAAARSRAATIAKRKERKVMGSAWGRPSLAPMKPVLQRNAKAAGTAATQAPWHVSAEVMAAPD